MPNRRGMDREARSARTCMIVLVVCVLPLLRVANAADACFGRKDLVLSHGQFLTMDARNTVAHAVRIRDGRLIAVDQVGESGDPCAEIVDLGGRTVIPGLIDSHTHFLRTAQQPGHPIDGLEDAVSIPDFLDKLKKTAASIPTGELIAAIGGFSYKQFQEQRLPTGQELDQAAPNNPVYLQEGYLGRAVVNTPAKRYLESKNIGVLENHLVPNSSAAAAVFIRNRDPKQVVQRFLQYESYANSLGLTMVVDQGCCAWLGTNLEENQLPGFDLAEQLWRDEKLSLRLRLQYTHAGGDSPVQARLANAVMGLGDDMMKVAGVGEWVTGSYGATAAEKDEENLIATYRSVAQAGWSLSQHGMTEAEIEVYLRAYEAVNRKIPVARMRWSLEHVMEISDDQIARLKAMGVGVRVQDQDYLRNNSLHWKLGSPPFRRILESGIHVGAGTDSGVVAPLNPWLSIYYMVTGRDASGAWINAGQQIGRLEALRLYTISNAWFTFDERDLGSLEVGKRADLAVLDKPFLAVSDNDLKSLHSLLTLINGRVVCASGPFLRYRQEQAGPGSARQY